MSAIVGVARFDKHPLEPAVAARMLERIAHRGPDARDTWSQESVGLGHAMLWTTPESLYERQPLSNVDDTLVLVADARIDNRQDLISSLALHRHPASRITDAELILAAYQKWEQSCPAKLLGDFAFAIWDKKRRALFCARDPLGVKSLYYHRRSHLFAFASEIKALFALSQVPCELNEERVAELLIQQFDNRASTFFREIQRLPAGHSLSVSAQGLRLHRYWALDPDYELVLGADAEYEEAFRDLLREAVSCRLRSAYPAGATLSGGLDSSSITCLAREHLLEREPDRPLHTFSAIFPSLPEADLKRIDERAFIRKVLALARGELIAHEIRADQLDPLGELESILWHQDDPLVPFNLYIHRGIYHRARQHGVRVILDGFDGDTTVSYGYERLADLAKKLQWLGLLTEARSLARRTRSRSMTTWKVIQTYALNPLLPAPPAPRRGQNSIIAKEFAHRMELEKRVGQLQREPPRILQTAREVHLSGLSSPLIPYTLELADKACAAFGLEARYPFFDRRLVEFSLALPARQKLLAGWPRSILRRSMQGILPVEVQWRKSKGNLSPNFHYALLRFGKQTLHRLIVEEIESIKQFVDVPAVNRLYERYLQRPTNADAMSLFIAATLAAWISSAKQIR